MADDLSLLFRLKAENTQAKAVLADTRAAVGQLRQSFGPQLTQSVTVANKTFADFGVDLQNFAAQKLPLVGGAVSSVTTAFKGLEGGSLAAGTSIGAMAGPIGLAVAAYAALATAAIAAAKEIFNITKQAADFQGKMFDLAQQTGLAVKTLSALEVVAQTTGGELGSITQAIVLFQRKLDDAQDPLSKTAEEFRKLGVSTADTETSLRSAFAALAKMPEGFAQTNAAAELFGARGGKQVLAILKETKGDLDGTIKRLEELGIVIDEDAARAADIFNDQLAILGFQTRALSAEFARDLIPVLVDLIKVLGELVRAVRPAIAAIGSFLATIGRPAVEIIKGMSLVIKLLAHDYEGLARAIKEAQEAQEGFELGKPLGIPEQKPIPLPGAPSPLQTSSEAVAGADAVLAEVKRRAAQTNQALAELFQRGRIDRQRQTESIIADNKRILQADTDRIDAELAKKEQEIKALDEAARNRGEIVNRETEQYKAINAAVAKLQQERLDKENEFDVTSRALRAKAAQERAQAQRDQIQNEGDIFVKETEATMARIEAEIKRGEREETAGFAIIDQLEQQKIESRINTLKRQKETGFLTVEEQKSLNNQLTQLQQERDRLEDDQRARRLQREIEAAARNREIVVANLDAIIQQEQIIGERRIETLKALAEQRVITEEDAAKQILAIRLGLIDDEIDATQAKLTASKSITDKNERIRIQTELNNQIKILTEERKSIQAKGDREIEDRRQKDLQNERRYADELKDIKARISDIERGAAQEVIRLMILHFARRRDIIRARLQLDIADENARHAQATETVDNLERENRESKKTQEEKLEAEKEINRLREAEAERHRLAMQGIKDQGKKDERDVEGIFVPGDLLPQIEEGVGVIEAATAGLKAAFEELKTIGLDAFSSLAQGIGSLVQNYVLLGTTGPAALRKLLAATLAQIAAESAVRAIYWTAQGIADLFFNPARAAADFTAAALFASIAGVSALAGRAVAGSLFKPQSSSSTGASGAGGNGELNPLNLARNAGPGAQQQIIPIIQPIIKVEVVPNGSKFDDAITAHYIDDHNNAGPMREIRNNDGNLNRG